MTPEEILLIEQSDPAALEALRDRLRALTVHERRRQSMPKKQSDLSRITRYFLTCTEPEAVVALDAAQTIVGERFGAQTAKTATRRASRKPKQEKLPTDGQEQK